MKKYYALFLILVLSSVICQGDDKGVLELDDFEDEYPVHEYVSFLEVENNDLKVEDVVKTNDLPFRFTRKEKLNFGFNWSVYWLKFSLQNNSDKKKELVFSVANPDLNDVRFYQVKDGQIIDSVVTGESRVFSTRDMYHPDFSFHLSLEPGEQYTYYLFTNNFGDSVFFPLRLMDYSTFELTEDKNLIINGLIFGIFFFIILFYFLFILLKESVYWHYAFYVLALSLFLFNIDGFSFQFLWPGSPWWAHKSTVLFIGLVNFFFLSFTTSFLDTRENLPKLHKGLTIIKALSLLFSILPFFGHFLYLFSARALHFITPTTFILIIFISIVAVRKRITSANYFLIAFLFIMIGALIYQMRDFGWLPHDLLTTNGPQIGFVAQVVMFSFALIDRFKRIKEEANLRLENQNKEIQAQKEELEHANIELEKLSIAASKTDNGIAIYQRNGELTWINTGFEKLYGFDFGQLISKKGKTIFEIIDHYDIRAKVNECLSEKRSIIFQNHATTASGDRMWTQTTLTPILDDNNEVQKMVAIDSNITKIKNVEKELLRAKDKAEESDRLKTAFLANMSHEIRTPMNAIIGFSNLLSSPDIPPDEKYEFLGHIISNSKSLLQLIDDIIDVSKIEAGQLVVKKSECLINQLLKELRDHHRKEMDRGGKQSIDLRTNVPQENSDLVISTDPLRLKQVLSNLIVNAIKFTEEGYIELGYEQKDEKLLFFVKDTGIGLPEDKKDEVFKRFMKIDNKMKLYGGAGLGLTISKNLVQLLGGEIWVESILGEGSSFYFTIPFEKISTRKAQQHQEAQSTKISDFNWKEKTILIAEDEDSNFRLLKAALSPSKVKILHAQDGKEAWEMACRKDSEVDLVLMDIKMPEMNGYEATQRIKRVCRDLPVIAQTAHAMAGERELSLKAGCDDYISKPINVNLLVDKIDKWMNNKHNEK